MTDAGEVTEAGRAYIPPRVLQEALCVISGVPGLEGDVTNTEHLESLASRVKPTMSAYRIL